MDKYIEEMKSKCKSTSRKHPVTIKDIKTMYYLWDDPSVSHVKLGAELHRSDRFLFKLNDFIKNYIKENNPNTDNEDFLNDILDKFIKS
jgi:hypothetical protein